METEPSKPSVATFARPAAGPSFLSSSSAFQTFVESWERGTLPKSQWNHAAHVAVCACYVVQFPSTAYERTKAGIIRYNEATGVKNTAHSGFHETLTRYWAGIVAAAVEGYSDPWAAAIQAVARFGEERDLHRLYYSFDIVRHPVARQSWIAPDLEGTHPSEVRR